MEIVSPASPRERVMGFLRDFEAAPNDADIEIRVGRDAGGAPAVLVSIAGRHHSFLATEARKLADIMERSMCECASDPRSAELPNTIMAIRAGCAKAESE